MPSLAYAGIPYQVFGASSGALAVMIAWSRSAIARSGPLISATFASSVLSPSALRASAFSSWARSFIAARSSALNPADLLFVAGFFSAIATYLRGESATLNLRVLVSQLVATGVKGRPSDGGGAGQARTRLARRAVVDAARSLFLDRGYQATTIDAISERSDVPPATVYRLFSSKLGILKALLDVSIAGDDRARSVPERPEVARAPRREGPRRLLAGFAAVTVAINVRSSDIYRILSSASGSDPAAAVLLAEYQRERGTTARGGSPARSPAPAPCGPGCASATPPT